MTCDYLPKNLVILDEIYKRINLSLKDSIHNIRHVSDAQEWKVGHVLLYVWPVDIASERDKECWVPMNSTNSQSVEIMAIHITGTPRERRR